MYLVLVTVLVAACGADKLDRTYLPPASAKTAGGSSGFLQTPFRSSNQGLGGLPKGGYSNNFEGVVVDAAAPGTRASGSDETGLGAPRIAYGSIHSKVGEAAFTGDTAFPRIGTHAGLNTQPGRIPANDQQIPGTGAPERIQASRDRASNTVKYESEVSHDSFNYAFETDNGIIAEENGIEVNGVKAQGGYSYTGDDGQVYSVTYTADEGGYRPRGDHLPTPPPIPEEILKSLEQNAKEEASGIVDDGSYDAQKYNTGEDYTKSDSANEKYNRGQPSRLGIRPQADTDASGSFVNQKNQAFGRPSSNQFGSQSFDNSGNLPSNTNAFGISGSANKPDQNRQKQVFSSGSHNEYLPPSNIFNQNRRPALNTNPQSAQRDQQTKYPHDHSSSSVANINIDGSNKEQNSQTQTFVPLSQQKLQDDNPRRPFGSSSILGKPTIIDSTLSIKDPFANRPSSNRFTQNKRPTQKPQATGGTFEVVSGNVYSSKNEYLPPRNKFNKPSQNGDSGFNTNSENSNLPSTSAFASVSRPVADYQSFNKNQGQTSSNLPSVTSNKDFINSNSPTVSSFAVASRPTTGFQSFRPQNGQYTSQYNQQISNTRLPLNQNQQQISSSFSSVSNSNRVPITQTQYKPSALISKSPTSQPQTELTTPLESNYGERKDSAPVPVLDGPDSSNLPGFSSLPTFGVQSTKNFLGQSSFNAQNIQKISPTQASAFASISGNSGASNQNRPESVGSNLGGTFSQFNKSPIDVQYSSSTLKPSYSQNSQPQGPDDSYYYNTPSKPFNVPTTRPEISRFSSSPFDQSFRVTQTPSGSRPQLADIPQTSLTSQNRNPLGSTGYPSHPLQSVSPTLPSNLADGNANEFQSEFNRVTQASVSSFPSPVPTGSIDVQRNQYTSQIDKKPLEQRQPQLNQQGQNSNVFNKHDSLFAQANADVPSREQGANQRLSGLSEPESSQFQQTQKYSGEIYEYKKPPQVLPVPEKGSFTGQVGQNSQLSLSASQGNQFQNSGNSKPSSLFGFQNSEQTTSSTGQTPQISQVTQGNQGLNLNAQVHSQSQHGLGSLSKPNQGSDVTQGVHTFNSNGQTHIQSQSALPGQYGTTQLKPTQNSQIPQGGQDFILNTQGQSQSRPGNSGYQKPQSRPIQGASQFPPQYKDEGPSCCKPDIGQSSQTEQQNQPQFGGQIGSSQGQKDIRPPFAVSSFAGIGESFGGPRKPPSFDENGYHY